jgi:hypothetical protein
MIFDYLPAIVAILFMCFILFGYYLYWLVRQNEGATYEIKIKDLE